MGHRYFREWCNFSVQFADGCRRRLRCSLISAVESRIETVAGKDMLLIKRAIEAMDFFTVPTVRENNFFQGC